MEIVVPNKSPAPFRNIRDTATATGLSQFFLRNGCKDGSVPHIKCGNQYMINVPLLLQQLDTMSLESEKHG